MNGSLLSRTVSLGIWLCTLGSPVWANTISVTTTNDEINSDGDCSLREAIEAANSDTAVDACPKGSGEDTIILGSGTFAIGIDGAGEDLNQKGDFDVTEDLSIRGLSAEETVLDGADLDRILHAIWPASLTVEDVTLTGGHSRSGGVSGQDSNGGAIRGRYNLTVRRSILRDNQTESWRSDAGYCGSGHGGAIYVWEGGSAVILEDVELLDNRTGPRQEDCLSTVRSLGGGVYVYGTDLVEISDCTITGNRANDGGEPGDDGGWGGGVFAARGELRIENSTITDNRAGSEGLTSGRGGGVDAPSSHGTVISGSTISGNSAAGDGGGLFFSSENGGNLEITNSTVSDNWALNGGGISADSVVSVVVSGSTISGNVTVGNGGGIHYGPGQDFRIVNSTVSDNSAHTGGGIYGRWSRDRGVIENCTIVDNVASDAGAGIRATYLSFRNSILVGNRLGDGFENCRAGVSMESLGYNVVGDGCDSDGAGDQVVDDTTLYSEVVGVLGSYGGPTPTHALAPDSPALDDGSCTDSNGNPVEFDQRGVPRPETGCDAGALESSTDFDEDGVPDSLDGCPRDGDKLVPGICGCGTADEDTDHDGTYDCDDECPSNPEKTEPDACGCTEAVEEDDRDGDETPDCIDLCPDDGDKVAAGVCGCGNPDDDGDGDETVDCVDPCPDDPDKVEAGVCGCGTPDDDSDGDETLDCLDPCPADPDKVEAGICGCGVSDIDSDDDESVDCEDSCDDDPLKTEVGICGCGVVDEDTDKDGVFDCNDGCPGDPNKVAAGFCGCGTTDDDSDGDRVLDCVDNCVLVENPTQDDGDEDGVGDACDNCLLVANPDQADPDDDAIGSACDSCPQASGSLDGCPEGGDLDRAEDTESDAGTEMDLTADSEPAEMTDLVPEAGSADPDEDNSEEVEDTVDMTTETSGQPLQETGCGCGMQAVSPRGSTLALWFLIVFFARRRTIQQR